MANHSLKCHPGPFDAIVSGVKTFEYRENDRDFMVGDTLELSEFDPSLVKDADTYGDPRYTGAVEYVRVTYIIHGPRFGISVGFCVMSIEKIEQNPPNRAKEGE